MKLTVLQRANVFLLGKVLTIMEDNKIVCSSSSRRPSALVSLQMYSFDQPTSTFICSGGKTALLKATEVLLANASADCISSSPTDSNSLTFHDDQLPQQLSNYVPYSDDIDIESRIPDKQRPSTSAEHEPDSDAADPYIVEQIIKKRFNSRSHQFEYLIKWQGYDSSYNTWELISNIPSSKLDAFEASLVTHKRPTPQRRGLRQSIKSTLSNDFVYNS